MSPQRILNDSEKQTQYGGTSPLFGDGDLTKGYQADVMVQIEGTVLRSHIAVIDAPLHHTHGAPGDIPRVRHDWNIMIAPDIQYQRLMSDANIIGGGMMELEWELPDHLITDVDGRRFLDPGNRETDGMLTEAIPAVGDHVVVRGRYMFDCGHPPFRAEIHPIDVIAVTHGNNIAKLRQSTNGGSVWYRAADVNLPGSRQLTTRFTEAIDKLVGSKKGNTGFGPLDDFVEGYNLLNKVIEGYRFSTGCGRRYDTEILAPSEAGYYPYKHAMNDLFTGHSTPTDAFPIAFTPADPPLFSFSIPGTQQVVTRPLVEIGQTEIIPLGVPFRSVQVCFERFVRTPHDITDPGTKGCLECYGICLAPCLLDPTGPACAGCLGITNAPKVLAEFCSTSCCDKDTSEELVTWVTAGDQAKIMEDGNNCLNVRVFPGDTLRIGSHGFECDFSCGERWDDPEFGMSSDERIGTTSIAFTEATNWGIGGQGHDVWSQPDLATQWARDHTANDYRLHVTITENTGQ